MTTLVITRRRLLVQALGGAALAAAQVHALVHAQVPAPAGPVARPLSAAEAAQVRAVVLLQLQAFAQGDAEAAFGFATEAIQTRFGHAGHFLAMVQAAYPMVVRPASTAFLLPERDDDGVVQQVQLRDGAGRLWLATYRLEQQADAAWRIAGCTVAPADTRLNT